MQGNRHKYASALYKCDTKNNAQCHYLYKLQTCKVTNKISAVNPYRKMDCKEHYSIYDYVKPFSMFADCGIEQPSPENHFFCQTYKQDNYYFVNSKISDYFHPTIFQDCACQYVNCKKDKNRKIFQPVDFGGKHFF